MKMVKQILNDELVILQRDIVQQQKDSGAWASGKTAAGYDISFDGDSHGKLIGFSYVGVLERGRKPGKVPYDFKEVIKRWIIAKGLQSQNGESLERMASSIAWVIHKEGTVLHRNGYKVDIFDTPLRDFSERLTNKIATYFTLQTANNIFTWPQ